MPPVRELIEYGFTGAALIGLAIFARYGVPAIWRAYLATVEEHRKELHTLTESGRQSLLEMAQQSTARVQIISQENTARITEISRDHLQQIQSMLVTITELQQTFTLQMERTEARCSQEMATFRDSVGQNMQWLGKNIGDLAAAVKEIK